jgi:hypothetical protein
MFCVGTLGSRQNVAGRGHLDCESLTNDHDERLSSLLYFLASKAIFMKYAGERGHFENLVSDCDQLQYELLTQKIRPVPTCPNRVSCRSGAFKLLGSELTTYSRTALARLGSLRNNTGIHGWSLLAP